MKEKCDRTKEVQGGGIVKFSDEELLAISLALNHINHYYKCGIIYETEKDHKHFVELELKLCKYLISPEQIAKREKV